MRRRGGPDTCRMSEHTCSYSSGTRWARFISLSGKKWAEAPDCSARRLRLLDSSARYLLPRELRILEHRILHHDPVCKWAWECQLPGLHLITFPFPCIFTSCLALGLLRS